MICNISIMLISQLAKYRSLNGHVRNEEKSNFVNAKLNSEAKNELIYYISSKNSWPKLRGNDKEYVKSSKILGIFQISENFHLKLEFWKSEAKIKLREQNWVEKIINMLKLAQKREIQKLSRFLFPEKILENFQGKQNFEILN